MNFLSFLCVLEYTSFLQHLNSMLGLQAIQMQILSWICPVSYCLPIPGGGASGGNNGGGEGAEGSGGD